MFPLQITNRKWRQWKFVDGFHRLPDSSSLFHVHGSTLSDRYYCEFLWSWEKFLWRWSTVQPKMRYATVVVKVHAGKTTKWAHALMIGKESLKGWWILTTLKKWTGWTQALFWKVVGDRFYSSSVPKYIYFDPYLAHVWFHVNFSSQFFPWVVKASWGGCDIVTWSENRSAHNAREKWCGHRSGL